MRWNLVLLVVVIIGALFVYATPWSNESDEVVTGEKPVFNSDDPRWENEYNRVVAIPYEAHYEKETNITKLKQMSALDCDEKVLLLYDFIVEHGGHNVWQMSLVHESGKYSHTFLIWEDKYYDPTSVPPAYRMEKEEYYKKYITYNGFNPNNIVGIGID